MKAFEQELIELRKDIIIAKGDISFLSFSCDMSFEGNTHIVWRVSCSVKTEELVEGRDDGAVRDVQGAMEHIHGCHDLGWALEECYRRAKWNLDAFMASR
jgi:hypothetical protein